MPFQAKPVVLVVAMSIVLSGMVMRSSLGQTVDASRTRVASNGTAKRESLAELMLDDARQWADREMYDAARRLAKRARDYRADWRDTELNPDEVLKEIDRLQFALAQFAALQRDHDQRDNQR